MGLIGGLGEGEEGFERGSKEFVKFVNDNVRRF
jgi:hypothetical protein